MLIYYQYIFIRIMNMQLAKGTVVNNTADTENTEKNTENNKAKNMANKANTMNT